MQPSSKMLKKFEETGFVRHRGCSGRPRAAIDENTARALVATIVKSSTSLTIAGHLSQERFLSLKQSEVTSDVTLKKKILYHFQQWIQNREATVKLDTLCRIHEYSKK